MTPEEVLDFYKTKYAFNKATGMNINALRYWIKTGFIPLATQYKLEGYSNGRLTAHLEHCKEFGFGGEGIQNMNIRGFLKLCHCEINAYKQTTHDNYYTNKVAFVFGKDDLMRCEHLYFRDDELLELENALGLMLNAIKEYKNARHDETKK
jgi:hypothetical protein